MALFQGLHMPSFGGATGWLNSEPLDPAGLRGRVVLVDFWTFTCINWLRTEPYVRAWSQGYHDDGLVVLGVHTPEFAFEHEVDGVRRAIEARGIDYPVALDNDYAVWSAFDNHYWPALYFVDREGIIRDHHFGEGRYEQSERELQRLLGVEREPVSVEGVGVEAEASWDDLGSPETYLGYDQARGFAAATEAELDAPHTYPRHDGLALNAWTLSGSWTLGPDRAVLHEAGGAIAYRFHARDVHLVLRPAVPDRPVRFRVLLDGGAPGAAHGSDVADDGTGVVREGRLYQLVRQPGRIRDATFEIAFEDPGVEAFVFTFG
jgi:thiol-disulfide isomerase/thioredoxin